MQFATLALAALASVASAQNTRVTVVRVAQNGSLTYTPNDIRVNVGEMVQFQFAAGNHTVTQSTFDQPCQPIAMHSNVTGFHSGFVPAAASAAQNQMSIFTINVTNTNPMWIYCAQGRHCENGMVMVINAPTAAGTNRTLANYRALAAQANTVVPGGGLAPGGGGGANGGVGGGIGGGIPGTTPDSTANPNGSTNTPTAGAGILAPATYMLMAAAGFAILL
ncbi:Cupredoxin [Cercophora newfieldiana]|uniref:Cupredoxin n=1 Tax=Cercophora newfieldiana TaxID=92897 RepID=A0AA39XS02_9PEZI|nr:Cupredoxin [Cercophora newfieldiana]